MQELMKQRKGQNMKTKKNKRKVYKSPEEIAEDKLFEALKEAGMA
jgi:hypothetical protein